jgi:hypothetical protein
MVTAATKIANLLDIASLPINPDAPCAGRPALDAPASSSTLTRATCSSLYRSAAHPAAELEPAAEPIKMVRRSSSAVIHMVAQ